MANNCYNFATLIGSKESLDLLEARLIESKKETPHLWYETFHQVLGIQVPENGDTYAIFGTKWFDAEWNRESDTEATLSGDSAWSPPSEFFLKLSDVYQLAIESEYEEGGCDFAGYYNCINGEVVRDDTYSYNMFYLLQNREFFIEKICEDITYGTYDDYEDFAKHNEDVVQALSPEEIEEIKEEFNTITK
jgi:hypothetical protein